MKTRGGLLALDVSKEPEVFMTRRRHFGLLFAERPKRGGGRPIAKSVTKGDF